MTSNGFFGWLDVPDAVISELDTIMGLRVKYGDPSASESGVVTALIRRADGWYFELDRGATLIRPGMVFEVHKDSGSESL